jgi:hypothetical protein
MTLIETITVGSGGVSSSEFINIPQDGLDLLLTISARSSAASAFDSFIIHLNSNTSFTQRRLYGNGSSTGSDTSRPDINAGGSTSNTFCNASYYFPNYTSSAQKTFSIDYVSENNATQNNMGIVAGISDTLSAAITSIQIAESVAEHTTYSLYKITAD